MHVLQSHSQITHALARFPLVQRVFDLSAERGTPVYLVGGTVRDLLIGRDTHDLDFVVLGNGLELARYIADQLKGHFVPLDPERRTGRVLLSHSLSHETIGGESGPSSLPHYLDIASLRGPDLHADLMGRDFTINAIAIAPAQEGNWRIYDPLDGHRDLSKGILRMALPSSMDNDPVRTLRAVRMQIQFDCAIEPRTRARLRAAVPLLERVSAERVRDEWFKILQLSDAASALKEMHELGLLEQVVPTLAHSGELGLAIKTVQATEHLWAVLSERADQPTGSVDLPLSQSLRDLAPDLERRYEAQICDERSYLAVLKCAALLHPTNVDSTTLVRWWRLSKREIEMLCGAIRHYSDVRIVVEQECPTRRSIYRFFAQAGEPGLDAALLYLAHTMAKWKKNAAPKSWIGQTEGVARLLYAWFRHRDIEIDPVPLLSGKDVMRALGQPPGPQIGELLGRLAEEQAAGKVVTRHQALEYVQEWKAKREQGKQSG